MQSLNARPTELADELELCRRIKTYLGSKHLSSLRQLDVNVQGGTITLSGRVHSFHERQIAVHSCRRVAGVRAVIDHLRVQQSAQRS